MEEITSQLRSALVTKQAEYEAEREEDAKKGFDTWDIAAIEYLQMVIDRLDEDQDPQALLTWLRSEKPRLQEIAEEEDAHPTFDWYDEHYHVKIAMGRNSACGIALRLCETYLQE